MSKWWSKLTAALKPPSAREQKASEKTVLFLEMPWREEMHFISKIPGVNVKVVEGKDLVDARFYSLDNYPVRLEQSIKALVRTHNFDVIVVEDNMSWGIHRVGTIAEALGNSGVAARVLVVSNEPLSDFARTEYANLGVLQFAHRDINVAVLSMLGLKLNLDGEL